MCKKIKRQLCSSQHQVQAGVSCDCRNTSWQCTGRFRLAHPEPELSQGLKPWEWERAEGGLDRLLSDWCCRCSTFVEFHPHRPRLKLNSPSKRPSAAIIPVTLCSQWSGGSIREITHVPWQGRCLLSPQKQPASQGITTNSYFRAPNRFWGSMKHEQRKRYDIQRSKECSPVSVGHDLLCHSVPQAGWPLDPRQWKTLSHGSKKLGRNQSKWGSNFAKL